MSFVIGRRWILGVVAVWEAWLRVSSNVWLRVSGDGSNMKVLDFYLILATDEMFRSFRQGLRDIGDWMK
jgi:hypothetical protein